MATFLVRTGERRAHAAPRVCASSRRPASRYASPSGATTERLLYRVLCSGLLQRLREQRHGLGNAPGQGIRRPQGRSHRGKQAGRSRPGRCPRPVRARGVPWAGRLGGGLADRSRTRPTLGSGVSNRLGDPEPLFPEGTPSANVPSSAWHDQQVHGSVTAGRMTCRSARGARPRGTPRPAQAVDRPPIVPLGLVGYAEVAVRQRLQGDIPAGRGERQGTLTGRDSLSYAPMREKCVTERARPVPADAGRRGPRRGSRPHAERQDTPKSPSGRSA